MGTAFGTKLTHIFVYRKTMKFLLSPGTKSVSNCPGIFWKDNFGCSHFAFRAAQHRFWKESVHHHVATLRRAFPSASLRRLISGWNPKKGEFGCWKRPSSPCPCRTDEESTGDVPNFSKCPFIFTCVWITWAYKRGYIFRRQTTTTKNTQSLHFHSNSRVGFLSDSLFSVQHVDEMQQRQRSLFLTNP